MKLLLSIALLQWLSHTSATCPETFTTTSCSLSSIETAAGAECDLGTALGGLNASQLEEYITNLCDEIDENATLDWTDVTTEAGNPRNYQWDNNYFDGGTSWNDETETATESLHSGDAGSILRTWKYHASNKIISWPTTDPNNVYYGKNWDNCESRVAMCCFTDTRLTTALPVNADVCSHDLHKSRDSNHINRGFAIFHEYEEKAYCTGFSWEEDENSHSARYKGNALFYTSMYHNLYENGFVENIPSSPLCACVEQMATVTKSDCVEVSASETYSFTFGDTDLNGELEVDVSYGTCATDDLVAHYESMATEEEVAELTTEHIVNDCSEENTKFANENYYVPGSMPEIADPTEWTLIVGKGKMYSPPVGETAFRNAIEASPNKIIRRVCKYCDSTHKDIYYKRLTDIPSAEEYDFLANFMDDWFSTPSNLLGVDFELYSSYEDAIAGVGNWTFCNYDDHGEGFPRDCGPTGKKSNNWNSYRRSNWRSDTHAFFVEKQGTTSSS